MKNVRIASRYSKALFSLSIELNKIDEVKDDMKLISETIAESPELKRFLLNPISKDDKKIKILNEIFGNYINKFTLKFLDIIIRKRRFVYINYIAEEFLNLYREHKNIKLAYFQTASAIDDESKGKIINILKDFTQHDIELYQEIKKELIGGFVLKIDDNQYDTSIKTKLLKFTKEFSVNPYEKGL